MFVTGPQRNYAPTISELALRALVEEKCLLQVARSGDFLREAIWARRIVFVASVDSLALRVALGMRVFCIGLESRAFTHGSVHAAITVRIELEKFGGPRHNFRQGSSLARSEQLKPGRRQPSSLHISQIPLLPVSSSFLSFSTHSSPL